MPATLEPGGIYFASDTKTVNVATDESDFESFGGDMEAIQESVQELIDNSLTWQSID